MSKKGIQATETELAILAVLWERGPTTVREIVDALYADHNPSLHATVKSLLQRLQDKGHVASDASGFAHRFQARLTREDYVGEQLKQLADCHFDGAFAPMLLSLVDRIKLSRKDREAIRKVIDGMREE